MPTATDQKMQILEVFSFLDDERPEARSMACEYSASISKQHQSVFLENNNKPIHDIMKLINDNPVTSNHAISCLINLTSDIAIVHAMATKEFIQSLVIQLLLPQNVNADLVCMLLNNLSRNEIVADVLLPDEEQKGTHMIDNMLEVFNKKEYTFNKSASFNFLGGVFANISTSPGDVNSFSHPDVMRRGGVISSLKNVAYGINIDGGNGLDLMLDDSLNMLVYILLPLSGSEDYDEEEMEGMPDELTLLDPDKKRETDPKIRLALVEILVLLSGTRSGRDRLRSVKTYEVIKKLHLQERNGNIQEMIERLVQMLMRDESPQN